MQDRESGSTDSHELKQALSLLNSALDSTADGILIVDTQGRMVKFNSKFATMSGVPADILASGDDARALAHVLDKLAHPEEFFAKVQELYSNPEANSFDLMEFKDGRCLERYSQPHKMDGQVVGRVWSFKDVTTQKRAEKELLDSRRQLEEFIAVASHELRTPLTSLKAQIQLINRYLLADQLEKFPKEKLAKLVGISDRELTRFAELVEALLDFSRIRTGRLDLRPEEVELGALVKNVAESLEPQLQAVRCEARLALPIPVRGMWDRRRLEQVLINLISNSMKFAAGKPIHILVRDEAGGAAIHVRDEGIGISEEVQQRIFDRFVSANLREPSTGMGLGLFISREIVRAHGGSLQVESSVGHGAEFIVRMPSAEA